MIIKCKMCGGDLHPAENATTCECEFCGTVQTIPNADNEKKSNLFNRANRLRMNNEFDKASAVYESIVAEFPEEAEAYWGLCLCAYGIEYVDDPATGNKMPTCHRTLPTSIMEDANFEQACDNADTIARKVYRDEAKVIDRIQKDILSIAANEKPYDVFICYKETDESGSRTEDSVLAQDVYDVLTAKGLKVFFSRITLEDKLGVQYEPYIYAALSSARVMLAFGTKYEYYDAVWVKNEWRRYLDMMRTDKSKALVPCFKGLDAYDMPKEFNGLQAQDMSKLGWMQDLTRGVEKLCGRTSSTAEASVTSIAQASAASVTVENLMKRARIFLEDGDFKNAKVYLEKVLDLDAEYAPAYVGKLCAKLKLRHEEELGEQAMLFMEDADWQKAMRYANDNQKKHYQCYAEQAELRHNWWRLLVLLRKLLLEKQEAEKQEQKRRQDEEKERERKLNEQRKKEADYKKACEAKKAGKLREAFQLFASVQGYLDSDDKMMETALALKNEALDKKIIDLRKGKEELEAKLSRTWFFQKSEKKELTQAIEKVSNLIDNIKNEQDKIKELPNNSKRALSVKCRLLIEIETGCVKFGTYPQTESGADKIPIEWIVLARDGNKALLISRYGLDAKPYNAEHTSVTWEICTLRNWLNCVFMNKAFTAEEQKSILTTTVDNSSSQGYWSTSGGNNTQDKIFLLSYAEVNKYFGVTYHTKSIVAPTAYAEAQGAYASSSNKTADGNSAGWWWLRSPGLNQNYAARVIPVGSLDYYVDYEGGCVRPALWVNLESGIF